MSIIVRVLKNAGNSALVTFTDLNHRVSRVASDTEPNSLVLHSFMLRICKAMWARKALRLVFGLFVLVLHVSLGCLHRYR